MAALTPFANFGVLGILIDPQDASGTAVAVAGSEMLFRAGVAAFVVVAVFDIIVAGALFEVFAGANRTVYLLRWLQPPFSWGALLS
jgi:hypothetical protein